MPPSSPPIYANAIIPDPHMAHIIAAISGTRAASSAPLAPVASSQIVQIEDSSDEDISVRPPVISSTSAAATPLRVIDIEDSSDEDIPSRTSINTSVQTPSRILPERVLVIEDSSEDEGAKDLWPKPGTHYREYNHKDCKELRKELSRMSKRVQAKEARDQQSRHVSSTSSYADDGTIGLIANLCIDDNGNIGSTEEPNTSCAPEAPHRVALAQTPLHIHQASPSRVKQRYPVYVVFAGRQPGIYDDWPVVKKMVDKVSHNIYKGYHSRLEAERVWVLANALGTTRILDTQGHAIAVPSGPMPPLVMDALGELPDCYLDAEWYVVVKGRTPGVYPAWNFAATQSQGVSGAVHKKYPNRAQAQQAFDRAKAAGSVEYVSIVF